MAEARSIDDVLQEIGEFGRYQQLRLLYFGGTWVATSITTLLSVFTQPSEPPWECVAGAADCTENRTFCEAFDAGLLVLVRPSSTVTGEFGWLCARSWLSTLSTSGFFVGMALGVTVFGTLADRYGRRAVFLWTLVMCLLVTTTTAAASGGIIYTFLRFLSGFSIGGFGLVAFIYGNEFVGASWRAFYSAYVAILFVVGELLLALAAYFIRDWRFLTALMGGIYTLYFLGIRATPESPKYLLVNGKPDRAKAVLKGVALRNRKEFPTDCVLRGEEQVAVADVGSPIRQLLWDPKLRRRLLVMGGAWFTCSTVYYGLSLASGSIGGNVYINFVAAALAEVPANCMASPAMNSRQFGRRKTLAYSLLLSGLLCLSFSLLGTAPQTVRVLISSLGKLFATMAFAVVYAFTGELFPTASRSSAMGICSFLARLGGVTSPFFVLLATFSEAIPFLIFGSSGLLFGCLSLMLPETRHVGRPDEYHLLTKADDTHFPDAAGPTSGGEQESDSLI